MTESTRSLAELGAPAEASHSSLVASIAARRTASRDAAADAARPWYRREPWLALALLAVIPVLVGPLVPDAFAALLIAQGALLLGSLALLLRQGPLRSATSKSSAADERPREPARG